jgi:uncharacterized membrane protein
VPNQQQNIDTVTKINILLKEYDALRAEMLQRMNARFAIVGLLGALLVLLISKWEWQPAGWPLDVRWLVAVLGAFILAGVFWRFGTLIQKLATRVSQVEQRVNQLAQEDLLTWETCFGRGRFENTRGAKKTAT